jgi:hypothetical protein
MSGAGREIFNMTDEIRLGRDLVGRNCREKYAADQKLCDLIKWHHGFVMPRRLSWEREQRESGIPQEISWVVWQGAANADQRAEYKNLASEYRKRCEDNHLVEFCKTSYSEPIWHTCDVALFHTRRGKGTQCHIRGDAGCGKTLVSRAWHQTNNHGRSIFFEPKGAGGVRSFLEELAFLMGVDRNCSYAKLINRVFGCFEPGMVLIVDEISLLVRESGTKQPVLDMLRRICDTTGASVVSLATDDKFESDLSASDWNDRQWWRRMSRIVDLPRNSPEPEKDIRALFEFRFPDFNLSDTLLNSFVIVNDHEKGGFGQVAKIFVDAEVEADLDHRKLQIKDLATCVAAKLVALKAVALRSSRRPRR